MPVFTKLDDYKREPIVNFMYRLQVLLLIILASSLLSAKQSERYYQTQYADKIGGRTEVVMKDGTRCDIVTSTHAIEVDFAKKWAEAIGQSLNYSLNTGKRAGIALILETQSDYKHLLKLNTVIRHHGLKIDVYPLYGSDYQTPTIKSGTKAFWITSSGKTHNSSCRYYGTTKSGRYTDNPSKDKCKVCGG